MIGTWQSNSGGAGTTYHFKPDGTFTMSVMFDATFANVAGKYRVEGDRLVMEPSSAEAQGRNGDSMKQALLKPSRVQMRINTPASISLMLPDFTEPLMLARTSETP